MISRYWRSLLPIFLAVGSLGATKPRHCLFGFVRFEGAYKEEVEVRKGPDNCLCFYEVACEDAEDPDCRLVKHLQFGCDEEKGSPVVDGRLKVHFKWDLLAGNYTAVWKRTIVVSTIVGAKDAFLYKLAEVRRNGPNDLKGNRMARLMVKIWEAGLFSAVRKHGGGTGRVRYETNLAWIPLATSGLLLLISCALYCTFRFKRMKAEK